MKKFCLVLVGLLVGSPAFAQSTNPGWGSAQWIWDNTAGHTSPQTNDPRFLRRTFDLPGAANKAELWITADNIYTAYINGQKIGTDSEWATVERYDVAKHLNNGKNVLAIEARNQGGVAGVIARLHVITDAKREVFVGTDALTRITLQKSADWLKVDFDDSKWAAASVLGDTTIGPWHLSQGPVAGGKNKKNSSPSDVSAVDSSIKNRLSAEEEQKHFKFPEGFAVELVAAEPLVINPVTMALDEKGRIYVSESHTYRYGPSGSPVKPYRNPLIRLDPSPDGKGLQRTLIADGFDDPVMGIAIRDGKLWLTANNYLYLYDLPETGQATNKKTILIDKNKAWNPFGMFVLEFGPDGLLYMSVGNHSIDIHGPDGKVGGRGSSGIVMRMNPDGTNLERLVHGLRVPYSFEYDPYGQLWLLSNGEGNPDRFVRVIRGVDYHCYSRPSVDNNWLAGNHPLAPPCFSLMRGAHTQLVRYYGESFPEAYQGNLFLNNWGAHGFAGPNRCVFRFVPDGRGNITTKEPLLSCTDPHFRSAHLHMDTDGSLLVADWYGRDDESDTTGRIWRLKYVGKDRRKGSGPMELSESSKVDELITALGVPSHRSRGFAADLLVRKGVSVIDKLKAHAASAPEPIGAAGALWVLTRIGTPEAKVSLIGGIEHKDWKVRRLAVELLRKNQVTGLDGIMRNLVQDEDPAVRLEAALTREAVDARRTSLMEVLEKGLAQDAHLRYESAWNLAHCADDETFSKLLNHDDESVRLAGLIALDVACYENTSAKSVALASLAKALTGTGKLDLSLALQVAALNGDASLAPALEALASRADAPLAVSTKALLVLKNKTGGLSKAMAAKVGKKLIEGVEKGLLPITTPADQLTLLEFLEDEGPTPFAISQITRAVQTNNAQLKSTALALARKFGVKSQPLAPMLWPSVFNPKTKAEDALESLAVLTAIEPTTPVARWEKLLVEDHAVLRTDAVRSFRAFKGQPALTDLLVKQAPALIQKDAGLAGDLEAVFRHLEVKGDRLKGLNLPIAETDKIKLTNLVLADLKAISGSDKQNRAILGRQVFDRTGCTKCHTTVMQNTPLAPSLKGIAAQKAEYLVESVLYPSKVIKTGFEAETIVTVKGQTLTGLVKDEGKQLRILNVDKEIVIAKNDVEERRVQKLSIMPEGQEALISRRELVDLVAYLATLK